MRRIVTGSLALLSFLFATPFYRAQQQAPSAVLFLDKLAATPARDDNAESVSQRNAENEQVLKEVDSFGTAPLAVVETSLPTILRYTDDTDQNKRTREAAAMFLMTIAIRPDLPDLLSTRSADIAQLLTDGDPVLQSVAVNITYWVLGRTGVRQGAAFVPALTAAVKNPATPQNVATPMLMPLLRFGSGQPATVESVHSFLTRSDLNRQSKIDSLRPLAMLSDLPEQIGQDLCTRFDDPDPQVRIAAIIAWSDAASQRDSTARYARGEVTIPSEDPKEAAQSRKAAASFLASGFAFVAEGKKRVEQIAADETENPKIRQLAKEDLAGSTGLNPNILEPNVIDPNVKPANPQ